MKKIRLLLVDEHPIFRDGLMALFSRLDDFQVIGEASDGKEGVDQISALTPDVTLMDIALPVINGCEVTRIVTKRAPRTRILILSHHEEPQYILSSIQAGAKGYITKQAPTADLLNAIRIVFNNNYYFCPSISEALV